MANRTLSPGELQALTGHAVEAGAEGTCAWPGAPVAEGRGAVASGALLFALVVGTPDLEAAGLAVWLSPSAGVARVASSAGEALMSWQVSDEGAPTPRAPGATIEADLADGTLVVANPGGDVVQFSRVGGRLHYRVAEAHAEASELLDVVQLHGWIADCRDEWLRNDLERFLGASTEPARLLTAAGRLCRLESTPPVAGQLPWQGEQVTTRVVAWARQLSPAQRRTLLTIARDAVDRTAALLDELVARAGEDGIEAADAEWQADFLRACHWRDDVEALLTLHDRYRGDGMSERVVETLDVMGGALVAEVIDLLMPVRDTRLERVAEAESQVWWVVPVVES